MALINRRLRKLERIAGSKQQRLIGMTSHEGAPPDGLAQDIVVIDQQTGLAAPADWLEFGHVEIEGNKIAAARLKGSSLNTVITPEEWQYERSLSQSFSFLPTRK